MSNHKLQFGWIIGGGKEWVDLDSYYTTLFLDSGFVRQSTDLGSGTSPYQDLNGFSFSDLQHDIGMGRGSDLYRAGLATKTLCRSPAF